MIIFHELFVFDIDLRSRARSFVSRPLNLWHLFDHKSLFAKSSVRPYLADPDLRANDGVYSRYLTNFSGGEGRYTVTLLVTDNQGRAFSFQRAEGGIMGN